MTESITDQVSPPEGNNKPSVLVLLLRYGVPLVITVGLCYLLFTGIDFKEMVGIIRDYCNFWWIGLGWIVSIFSHVFRAMRWRIQLKALDINVPLYILVYSIFGTYAVNLVFPRLGEVWRTGFIAKREDASFTAVFGSMVAERLADTLTVLLLTVITFILAGSEMNRYLAQNPDAAESVHAVMTNPWLWTSVGVVVIGIWLLFTRVPDNKLIRKVKDMWQGLWEGFAIIIKMPGKGKWLLLTGAVWGCYFTQLFIAFHAFSFTTQIIHDYTILAVLVTFVLSSISMGVPSNGGIGPWQWSVIFALSFYSAGIILPDGVSFKDMSTSFANLVMGTNTLLLIILGLITFIAISIDKRSSRDKSDEPMKM